MAEQIEVPIIAGKAIQNLVDLKQAIKDAKDALATATLGTEDYNKKLQDLTDAQDLLRNAMYATKADTAELKKTIDGTGTSYNALVKKMGDLKREFRATEDAAKRMQLAGQIKDLNDQLKELDAAQGNFQRNVGNYASALKGLPPTLGKIRKEAGDIGETLNIMGKQPILGMIGLLAPLIMKIADELKENEKAMAGIQKLMDSLKPVTDFFAGILDKIADVLFVVIDEVTKFLGSSGLLNNIIKGVMGVGNAILKFVIAPFKGVIEAIKVFKEKGVKGLGDAARAFGAEMKQGVAFKENFSAGQVAADTILSGMASRKKKAKETGQKIAKDVADGLIEELDGILDKINDAWDKKLQDRQKLHEQRQKEISDYNKEQAARFLEEQEAEAAELADEWVESYRKQAEAAEESAKRKIAAMDAFATGTADLLGAIADAYESNGELTEKEEKRVKNLRIAAATINMLQGAVTAFATAQELGPIAGPIVGAINAAAVVATGIANIAKIKATNVSRDSAPTTTAPTQAAATVSAPTIETAVPTTTVVNGASTEAALNNAAKNRKVYLVYSEAEAMGEQVAVTENESSF